MTSGTKLGPYEIVSSLGAGGMGEVYRARDARLERDVAIKVLPEHLARDREALARFEREAKAVAALNHPNILAIHDVGDDDGVSYVVMELLEGETLRSRLSRSAPAWQKTIEIVLAVSEGLTAAHAKGIIHRDLKPENIFLYLKGRYHWNKRTADGLKTALGYFQQAVEKDSSYAMAYAGLADGYLLLSVFAPNPANRFAASGKAAAVKALEMDSNFPMGHYWRGVACGLESRHDEAIPALEIANRGVGSTFTTLELARAYAAGGRIADARRLLAEMHQTFDRDYAEPYGFALAYAALGEADQAFQWLERAATDRSSFFAAWVNGDPRLDSLSADPRLADLLRRMGLVPMSH